MKPRYKKMMTLKQLHDLQDGEAVLLVPEARLAALEALREEVLRLAEIERWPARNTEHSQALLVPLGTWERIVELAEKAR